MKTKTSAATKTAQPMKGRKTVRRVKQTGEVVVTCRVPEKTAEMVASDDPEVQRARGRAVLRMLEGVRRDMRLRLMDREHQHWQAGMLSSSNQGFRCRDVAVRFQPFDFGEIKDVSAFVNFRERDPEKLVRVVLRELAGDLRRAGKSKYSDPEILQTIRVSGWIAERVRAIDDLIGEAPAVAEEILGEALGDPERVRNVVLHAEDRGISPTREKRIRKALGELVEGWNGEGGAR